MYLLDTNVLSEIRRAHRADRNVWTWSQNVTADLLFISVVTILEIEQGILSVERHDPQQSALYSNWLRNRILPRFAGRILSFDTVVALRCAKLHVPDRRPERDAMIAATALSHSLTVATRNTRDFEACGVPTFNPWLTPA